MAKQRLDLSNFADAESSRNNTAITGIIIMNVILALAYLIEVVKGARTIASYAIVAICCILPVVLCLVFYARKKNEKFLHFPSFILLLTFYLYNQILEILFCMKYVLF